MKIFRLVPRSACAPLAEENEPGVLTVPDTALLIQKRPFFIPDFAADCRVQLCAVARICRLGRSIHTHFVPRYYDASCLTLGVHFIARDLLDHLRAEGLPWDVAVGFDNAVAVADAQAVGFAEGERVGLKVGEDEYEVQVPEGFFDFLNRQIARISVHYTLRQGDLFLVPLPLAECPVAIDHRLTLTVGDASVLSFNIK